MRLRGRFDVLNKSSLSIILFVFKLAAAIFIFWFLTHHSLFKFELLTTLFYKPVYALLTVCLLLLAVLVNTWRWYFLNIAQNIYLRFSSSLFLTYIGIAFNTIIPGSIGGDVVRCYQVMKRLPEYKNRIIISTVLDRVCGLMGIILITLAIIIYRYNTVLSNEGLSHLGRVCFLIVAASIVGGGIFLFLPQSRFATNKTWLKPLGPMLEAMKVYRNSKMRVFQALMAAVVTQFILLLVMILINAVLGLPSLPAHVFMIALAIAQIANLIPLTPGGLGIGEAAFANVILLFQPEAVSGYATVFFVYRFFSTMVYLPGAVWGIFGKRSGPIRVRPSVSIFEQSI